MRAYDPSAFFEAEHERRCDTPAARYAERQYDTHTANTRIEECRECGVVGRMSGNHRVCNRCRGKRGT